MPKFYKKEEITSMTPKGIPFQAQIVEIDRKENEVSCSVIKDGGDDPDITNGISVYSEVRKTESGIVL